MHIFVNKMKLPIACPVCRQAGDRRQAGICEYLRLDKGMKKLQEIVGFK